jgi:hypothetical protein
MSFVKTDDEAMSTTGYANAPAGKLGDCLTRKCIKYTSLQGF